MLKGRIYMRNFLRKIGDTFLRLAYPYGEEDLDQKTKEVLTRAHKAIHENEEIDSFSIILQNKTCEDKWFVADIIYFAPYYGLRVRKHSCLPKTKIVLEFF